MRKREVGGLNVSIRSGTLTLPPRLTEGEATCGNADVSSIHCEKANFRITYAVVMLSEAKHLWPISIRGSSVQNNDPRFFASLRMTNE